MTRKEYNGWTNYETWAVALWLDNEEGSQRFWHERAHELADELRDTTSAYARFTGREIFTLKERVTQKLADELKDSHEEANPLPDSGVFTDLLKRRNPRPRAHTPKRVRSRRRFCRLSDDTMNTNDTSNTPARPRGGPRAGSGRPNAGTVAVTVRPLRETVARLRTLAVARKRTLGQVIDEAI